MIFSLVASLINRESNLKGMLGSALAVLSVSFIYFFFKRFDVEGGLESN